MCQECFILSWVRFKDSESRKSLQHVRAIEIELLVIFPLWNTWFQKTKYSENASHNFLTSISILSKNPQLPSLQPKDSGGAGGETRESYVYRQAGEMLAKLPVNYVPFEVRQRLQKMGHLMPMNIFLKQEIDRMSKVNKICCSQLFFKFEKDHGANFTSKLDFGGT